MQAIKPITAPRVLIVDDEAGARDAIKLFLEAQEWSCQTTTADGFLDAIRLLGEEVFDVVLCDIHLRDGSGIDLIRHYPTTPFVMITGDEDARYTVEAMRAGAFDYFMKGAGHKLLPLLALSVQKALEKRQADRRAAMLSAAVRCTRDAIFITDEDGTILYANEACQTTYQCTLESLHGKREAELWSTEAGLESARLFAGATGEGIRMEGWHRRATGISFPVHLTRSTIAGPHGEALATVSIVRDISEQKAVERRIRAMLETQEHATRELLHVFNQLRTGVMLTDASGLVTFANRIIVDLRQGMPPLQFPVPIGEILEFDPETRARLEALVCAPQLDGQRLDARVDWDDGRQSWLEIEARAGYVDSSQIILFVHDLSEVKLLRQQLEERSASGTIVGRGDAIREVIATVRQVAPLAATVLIQGETGTGKELVAREIHAASPWGGGPFIAINCGALSESLLASQLFGHRRGAFTGAVADHAGFFETANGGTVLLDEIGDMPLPLQTALLRVLEQREIVRIGDSVPRPINVRILAATNQDLEREVREGRFRSDLYYRVRVARITLPPLRARREDIPILIQHALRAIAAHTGRPMLRIDSAAIQALVDHPWPGNVRELINAMEFASMTCTGTTLTLANLPPEFSRSAYGTAPAVVPGAGSGNAGDAGAAIRAALAAAGGNRVVAARQLGISRATLYRRLKKFEIV